MNVKAIIYREQSETLLKRASERESSRERALEREI